MKIIPLIGLLLLLPAPGLRAANRSPYDTLMQAQTTLEKGHYAAAEEALAPINSPSIWDFWKNTLLAQAKLGLNQPQEALNLLGSLPAAPVDFAKKDRNFYRNLYKKALETGQAACMSLSPSCQTWANKLWALFPEPPRLQKRGKKKQGQTLPSGVTISDKVTRLHILFQESRLETIPSLLTTHELDSSQVSVDAKCRAFLELGLALNKLNKKDAAAEALDHAAQGSCEENQRARALYWKGLIEYRLGKLADAAATYEHLIKTSPNLRYADDAYLQLSKIYAAQDDAEKAERALRKLEGLPEGDVKEGLLWDEAFGAYRNGEYTRATKLLDRIAGLRSIGTEAQPQALYWKARIAEKLSRKTLGGSSASLYRKVIASYPFSFYALLAKSRLGKSLSKPSLTRLKESPPSGSDVSEAIQAVDELNKDEAHESARDLLDYISGYNPDFEKSHRPLMAERWMEAGDFNRSLTLASEHFEASALSINLNSKDPMTRALYPLAYPEDVKSAAETNRLPSGLIAGIMREESLFLEDVRSHAGAIGLMQLMPGTARLVARQTGFSLVQGDLTTPHINIRLGSHYLKSMLDLFGEEAALAVMAYNAGPGNVSRWLRSYGNLPLDEFIENIPLSETRGYVKRVLRSAYIYGYLWRPETLSEYSRTSRPTSTEMDGISLISPTP